MSNQKSQSQIYIESEIAPLKKVLIHTPGPEIECMEPDEVDKYLFHGVIFLKDLLKDYTIFKNILAQFAHVYEIKECLADVFQDASVREKCIDRVLKFYGHLELKSELLKYDPATLARVFIEGLESHKAKFADSFSEFSSHERYLIQPLPNLYFARDTSIVVGHKAVSAHMAHAVRFVETILTRTIFEHHPHFKGDGFLLDACNVQNEFASLTLEGGDIHVWHKDLYLIGVSARTNPAAIDAFVEALTKDRQQKKDHTPFHVLAVFLPKTPSMIHLDMIATRINQQQILAYEPAVFGANSFHTVKITVNHLGKKHFENMDNLLVALKSIGYSMDPVFCGDRKSLINQKREQWVSGTNSFALAPGQIITYENQYTLKALEHAGFKIVAGKDFIHQADTYKSQDNIVITVNGSQLAQGGGGPRCMTCPILRG